VRVVGMEWDAGRWDRVEAMAEPGLIEGFEHT